MGKKAKQIISSSFFYTCAIAGAAMLPSGSAEAESYRYQVRPSAQRAWDHRYYQGPRSDGSRLEVRKASLILARDANDFYSRMRRKNNSRTIHQRTLKAAAQFSQVASELARATNNRRFGQDQYDHRLRALENRYEKLEHLFTRERRVNGRLQRAWRNVGNSYRQLYRNPYLTPVRYHNGYSNGFQSSHRPYQTNQGYRPYYTSSFGAGYRPNDYRNCDRQRIKNRLR